MGRPVTVSLERILDAARATFLEKGMQATTAEIAARAGVSEGSLFNRFKDKFQLFLAAMNLPYPEFLDAIPAMVGSGDPRANMERIAADAITFIGVMLPKMMMLMSNRNLLKGRGMNDDAPPLRAIRTVSGYLEAEMNLGRVRRCDPHVAARMLVGASFHYCLLQMLGQDALPIEKEAFVRGMVRQLWDGLAPAPPARARRAEKTAAGPSKTTSRTRSKTAPANVNRREPLIK